MHLILVLNITGLVGGVTLWDQSLEYYYQICQNVAFQN